MNSEEFNNSLRTNIFGEFKDSANNETVLYIEFDDVFQRINVGTASNCGLRPHFSVKYNNDLSLDQNIQNLVDEIYDRGYSDLC